jgi:hypothetical protein
MGIVGLAAVLMTLYRKMRKIASGGNKCEVH